MNEVKLRERELEEHFGKNSINLKEFCEFYGVSKHVAKHIVPNEMKMGGVYFIPVSTLAYFENELKKSIIKKGQKYEREQRV